MIDSPIRRHPSICGGALTIHGTRVHLDTVIQHLQGDHRLSEICEYFPTLDRELLIDVLDRLLRLAEEATPLEEQEGSEGIDLSSPPGTLAHAEAWARRMGQPLDAARARWWRLRCLHLEDIIREAGIKLPDPTEER
jgi:uncharacterized protein (DUF433 family)